MQQRPSNQAERREAQVAAAAAMAAAERAAEAAGRAAKAAKEWAAPRAEQAGRVAARKATPYVKRAGGKAEQWADVAHGAIVGAAIPAVIAAFERASQEQVEEEPIVTHRNNTWAKVLIPVLVAGAAGAALVIWARKDPRRQPDWAPEEDDWDFSGDDTPTQRLRDGVNRVVDATQEGAKRAAEVVAGAAEGVATQAAPYVEKAAATAKEEAERLRAGLIAARSRAASGLAETLDDAEDVWEDEAPEPVKPVRKARAPKA